MTYKHSHIYLPSLLQHNTYTYALLHVVRGTVVHNLKNLNSSFYYEASKVDQFLGTLTGRGVSRVNYEVPRLSKLHEDARRCSKDFQQVWYELEMFKVCRDDMPCEVDWYHISC